jgi:hypothetical protein
MKKKAPHPYPLTVSASDMVSAVPRSTTRWREAILRLQKLAPGQLSPLTRMLRTSHDVQSESFQKNQRHRD